jgi:5-methylcytosine-specific restriction protein A
MLAEWFAEPTDLQVIEGGVRLKFSEVEQVQRHVESLLPDKEIRLICLSILADSIKRLHAHGADTWGTHCTNESVRLLGGSIIVLTLHSRCLWLSLDKLSLEASQKLRQRVDSNKSWRWDVSDYPQYSRVPSKNGYYVPSPNRHQDWLTLRPLHLAYLDRVAHKFQWLNIKSQRRHNTAFITYLRRVLGDDVPKPDYGAEPHKRKATAFLALPEEIPDATTLYEGSRVQITVNAYERNPVARQMCIDHFGAQCVVCGFDFAENYGRIATGIIHVHHLTRLADISEAYEVDPIEDLRPVCPNCHVVIHKRNPPYTIDEVKGFISGH